MHADKVNDASCEEQPVQKSFSCVLCAQRKVKCDKQPGGCANCTQLRVQYVYKAPPPPRRRKKGLREIDVTARLRIYEDGLRQLGVDLEELVKQEFAKVTRGQELVTGFGGSVDAGLYDENKSSHVVSEVGVLLLEEGKSRYLENDLWASLQKDLRESREMLDEVFDEESFSGSSHDSPATMPTDGASIILRAHSVSRNPQSLHPTPTQARNLWQAYLNNINPLVRVCYAPTLEQLILNANGNLHALPRDVEALLFAIYFLTVESLNDQECIEMLGQPKSIAIRRFRQGAQHALINANSI